jgi:cobyrinic acid a,c-diamide synthase
MYLSERLTWQSNTRKMVGVIPISVTMHAKPQGRGYVRLRETAQHPWPLGRPGEGVVSAHEFHYSAVDSLGEKLTYAYEVERGFGLDGVHDGIVHRNLLASYAHLRDTRANPWAGRFVEFVRSRRKPPAS